MNLTPLFCRTPAQGVGAAGAGRGRARQARCAGRGQRDRDRAGAGVSAAAAGAASLHFVFVVARCGNRDSARGRRAAVELCPGTAVGALIQDITAGVARCAPAHAERDRVGAGRHRDRSRRGRDDRNR